MSFFNPFRFRSPEEVMDKLRASLDELEAGDPRRLGLTEMIQNLQNWIDYRAQETADDDKSAVPHPRRAE